MGGEGEERSKKDGKERRRGGGDIEEGETGDGREKRERRKGKICSLECRGIR